MDLDNKEVSNFFAGKLKFKLSRMISRFFVFSFTIIITEVRVMKCGSCLHSNHTCS